ncbi:DMT family transporter [Rhodococcus sp. IEGM 1330]|uniref:DMT family transporter n=1 Tax=Rhodococcus sp. IEGM 1330 TaxID=3082225 RepID=UPI002953F986|nr:DMT family transporter [Rhodococcus sp. IEGM 1330]MDV8022666.1 DMT family transporter [Rhodococcus sp. IEGM 1330]
MTGAPTSAVTPLVGFVGFIGVVGFSLTLPITASAVGNIGPELAGPGRTVLAAVLAIVMLLATRNRLLPSRREALSVLIVAAGCVIGFPLLTAHALESVSASHSAVTLALVPAATAVVGVVRTKERPSARFWCWCVLGTGLAIGYLVSRADGVLGRGDVELFFAVIVCAIGYAEGAVLSKRISAWVVTCWSVVVGAPVALVIVLVVGVPDDLRVTASTVLAFTYLALGSAVGASVAWYWAMARGGIARVGQIQLLQPLLTMLFAGLLLGERLDPWMFLVGTGVAMSVLMAQKTRVRAPASAVR